MWHSISCACVAVFASLPNSSFALVFSSCPSFLERNGRVQHGRLLWKTLCTNKRLRYTSMIYITLAWIQIALQLGSKLHYSLGLNCTTDRDWGGCAGDSGGCAGDSG